MRRFDKLSVAMCFLTGLGFAALAGPLTRVPNPLIEDDGYFYSRIAYNLGVHSFSSFDNINVTSGYHLLWGLALGALSKLLAAFTIDRSYHMIAHLAFAFGVIGWTAFGFFKRPLEHAAIIAIMVWSFAMTEVALLGLLQVYLISRFVTARDSFLKSPVDLLVIALIPLTRIDALAVLGVLGLYLLIYERQSFVRFTSAAAVGAAAQLVTMRLMFGHWFGVASLLKTQAMELVTSERLIHNFLVTRSTMLRTLLIVAMLAICAYLFYALRDWRERTRWAWAVAAVTSFFVAHFFLSVMRSWYLAVPLICLMLLVSVAIEHSALGKRAVDVLYGLTCACTALLVCLIFARSNSYYWAEESYAIGFIDRVNALVPPNEPIYQISGAGYTAYWLEPSVVNGDGLVNSHEYLERMNNLQLASYLEDSDICLIIRDTPVDGDVVAGNAGLMVRTSDVEVLEDAPTTLHELWQYRLFLLKAPRCQRLANLTQYAYRVPAPGPGHILTARPAQ